MIDILCLGHSAYDISFSLDEYPREDQKYITSETWECGGGPAANAAYLLAKWRLCSGYGGVVGQDLYGKAIGNELKAVGTDLRFMDSRTGFMTPQSSIIINRKSGSRTLINRRGKNLDAPVFSGKIWESVSPQVLLADGHYHELAVEARNRYPESLFILDGGSLHPGTEALAPMSDYLIVSEPFARDYSSLNSLNSEEALDEAINKIQDINGRFAAITLGDRGLVYKSPEERGIIPPFTMPVLDTTGAGDIFHGAFAYCIYWGMEFVESLEFSALAAALSIQKAGARSSIPELDDMLKEWERLG